MDSDEPTKTVIVVGSTRPAIGMEEELQRHGITMRWAQTIDEAAALLKSVVPKTVVLTELAFKDGNWRNVLEKVRHASIPVLLVSSSNTAELWWEALDCGVEDIVPSPLSASWVSKYLEKQFRSQSNEN